MAPGGGPRSLRIVVFPLASGILASGAMRTAPATSAAGSWEGEARSGTASLPLTVTIEARADDFTGTVDVPSQYALGYPLADLRVDSTSVTFSFPDLLPPASFEGILEHDRIRGHFTSAIGTDTLDGTFELRSHDRVPPPYGTQSVRFRNGDLELAGTLFQPSTNGPHPAVVFVHGSGPQTRDSYIRWFADQFARAGFVALIYDKRGTGESGGTRWPQTPGSFHDLADDAVTGTQLLRSRPDVQPDRIGVWGLSQGAWIAPIAATRSSGLVRFVIVLSGGGVSPAEQELYDDEFRLRDLGFADSAIAEATKYLRLADQYVRTGRDEDWRKFSAARDAARSRPWYRHLDRFPQVLPREAPVWVGLRPDLDYNPVPVLETVNVPVLLILGEQDPLTPASETARRVEQALAAGGNRQATTWILPGANHALLTAPSRNSPWLAERPAGDWVADMIEWTLRTIDN